MLAISRNRLTCTMLHNGFWMPQEDRSIAICATFTAEALEPALNFWVSELGLECPIRFAGYGQVFQQLLDPNSLLGTNRGYNLVLVRLEDWREAGMADSAARLAEAIRGGAARFHAPLVILISPSRAAAAGAVEQSLAEALAGVAGVSLLRPRDVAALYPVAEIHDPHADELGRLPYTPLYFAALATAAARRIHALAAPPFKLVALDCDDTLWAGICGEDGPAGVTLDEPRRGLQEFFAERKRQGMLLALVSKNNEEDVLETFRAHPEMPLALEDFVAHRINWEPKSANLASLAAELSPFRCRPTPPVSPPSCARFGPSTAPASPPRICAARVSTTWKRSAPPPDARPPASTTFWLPSISRSTSPRSLRPRFPAWPSSPSAPTR
jgi:HAD superfamily phosphatase (TIGR01681 family)